MTIYVVSIGISKYSDDAKVIKAYRTLSAARDAIQAELGADETFEWDGNSTECRLAWTRDYHAYISICELEEVA